MANRFGDGQVGNLAGLISYYRSVCLVSPCSWLRPRSDPCPSVSGPEVVLTVEERRDLHVSEMYRHIKEEEGAIFPHCQDMETAELVQLGEKRAREKELLGIAQQA